jgi:glycosyltransferase involved in cell wall biosynthesis
MTKRVLIISLEFPPLGTGGVLRCTKYVKYLRDFQWDPVVLTVDENPVAGGTRDYALLEELPVNVEIHRTPYPDFDALFRTEVQHSNLLKLFQSLDDQFPGILSFAKPDKSITWFPFALEKAQQIVSRGDIGIVYTDSPPSSSSLLGCKLKETYGIPWVADFRDPWSLDELAYEALGSRYHKRGREIDTQLEKIILEKCDQVIVVSEKLRQRYLEQLDLSQDRITVISDGYDEDDYKGIPDYPEGDKNLFKIKYAGSFYGSYNPSVFLRALHSMITSHNIKDIRFHVVGHGSKWLAQNLDRLGLNGIEPFMRLEGHMDSKRCLSEILNSSLLLAISPSVIDYNVPQKIYTYMRTGVPIFAVMPERGEAAQIIRDYNAGYVVDASTVDGVEKKLYQLYLLWKEGLLGQKTDFERLKYLEKRYLTGRLAKLFNGLLRQRDQEIQNFLHKGECLYEEGRYEEALRVFQEALDLNPLCPETLNNIGVMLFFSRAYEKAYEVFRKAVEIEPRNKDALINLCQINVALGKQKEAEKILAEIKTLHGAEDLDAVI